MRPCPVYPILPISHTLQRRHSDPALASLCSEFDPKLFLIDGHHDTERFCHHPDRNHCLWKKGANRDDVVLKVFVRTFVLPTPSQIVQTADQRPLNCGQHSQHRGYGRFHWSLPFRVIGVPRITKANRFLSLCQVVLWGVGNGYPVSRSLNNFKLTPTNSTENSQDRTDRRESFVQVPVMALFSTQRLWRLTVMSAPAGPSLFVYCCCHPNVWRLTVSVCACSGVPS